MNNKESMGAFGAPQGPSRCGNRGRAEDAAEGARQMAQLLKNMDGDVVWRMVQAREAATNIHRAFPGGDQRFIDAEENDDDDISEASLDVANAANNGNVDCRVLENEEGDEDVGEACVGLLDDVVDCGPLDSLRRMKDSYDFDLVSELDAEQLDFLQRIRLVNWIRIQIRERHLSPQEAIFALRGVLSRRDEAILENDALLEPVVSGDILLTVLESASSEESENKKTQGNNSSVEDDRIRDAVIQTLRSEDMI